MQLKFYTDGKNFYLVNALISISDKLKTTSVKIDDKLFNLLNDDVWLLSDDIKSDERIKPLDVIDNKDKYPAHYKKIMMSDTRYPIIMVNSTFRIVDGYHRLCKHIILKKTHIDVRFITVQMLKLFKFNYNKKPRTIKEFNKLKKRMLDKYDKLCFDDS